MQDCSKARVMAINDPFMDLDYLVYLLRYDSVHGGFKGTIEKTDGGIMVNGEKVEVLTERDPTQIPWGRVGSDYVAECTGAFVDTRTAGAHL